MGATRNTGYIENLIAYDGNNNIGVGGPVNVLYKVTIGGNTLISGNLNVTGTITFSSNVTANSFVKNGGVATEFLKADGTVDTSTYATVSYVDTSISNLIDAAPAALNTLNELAAALGDDSSFSTTVTTALGNRLRIDTDAQGLTSEQKANGRTNLGVVIGTDVQAYDADLGAIAALTGTSGLLKKTAANTWTLDTNTYLTSYTETDTLATVTGRGASTTTAISINSASVDHVTLANRFHFIGSSNFHITNNAYYNAAFKYQTAAAANKITIQSDGAFIFDYAASGTIDTNITWTTVFSVSNAGTATASSFVKSGGTSAEILAANGSVITAGTNITISGGTISAADVGFANPMTTLGDIIYGGASGVATRLAGNITTTKQYLSQTGNGTASAAPSWATIAGSDITGAALTETDDTNVTLTLGGSPSTALLRAVSLTLGWTGTLAVSRGGTGASSFGSNQIIYGNSASALQSSSQFTFSPTGVFFINNTISAGGIAMNLTSTVNAAANNDIIYGVRISPTFNNLSFTGVTQRALGVFGDVYINGTITGAGWGGSTITVAKGGTGLTALGTAGQLIRVNSGATALEYFTPSYLTSNFDVTGTVRARSARTTYRDNSANPSTDAPIRSLTNADDNWIYLDSASTEWGIYHRNIDTDLVVAGQPTLKANSIAFVGGNNLQAYICLADGDIFGKRFVRSGGTSSQFLKADGSIDSSTYLTSYTETDTLASVTGRGATTSTDVTFGADSSSDKGIRINYGNYVSGYGRIRFLQDGSNHSTIHSFSATWQNGGVTSSSTGCINIDGQNGVTFGTWNDPDVAFSKTSNIFLIRTTNIGHNGSTPSSATGWNGSSVARLQSGSTGGNVYLEFRTRADVGDYAGLIFTDNNNGGYIAWRNYVGAGANDGTNGDYMLYGTYTDHIFQAGSSNAINGKPEVFRIFANGNIRAIGSSTATTGIFTAGDGGAGSQSTVVGIRVRGLSGYDSLELGIENNYAGVIRSYGNDIRYYSGHWKTVGLVASEDHSHYWYTSRAGSSDWSNVKMRLDHTGQLTLNYGPLVLDWTNAYLYIKSVHSGSGVQWHDQIWLGRYDRIQTAAQYPNYLPAIAYGIHITQTSDAAFFGLIGRGANYNDYNCVIAWGDDSPEDVFQYRFNNNVIGTITPSGALTMSSDITAFSDIRIKENITTIDNALEKVLKLRGVYYNRTDLKFDKSRKVGFIAQEVQDVIPEIVTYDEQIDRYAVTYGNTVAILVEAIKEQQKQIEELKSQIKNK